jgi:hypothetical protein
MRSSPSGPRQRQLLLGLEEGPRLGEADRRLLQSQLSRMLRAYFQQVRAENRSQVDDTVREDSGQS